MLPSFGSPLSWSSSMVAVLCDANGTRQCGSDGVVYIDGRLTRQNQVAEVRQYRERFKKNYPHKYEAWTHCRFTRYISDIDTPSRLSKIYPL